MDMEFLMQIGWYVDLLVLGRCVSICRGPAWLTERIPFSHESDPLCLRRSGRVWSPPLCVRKEVVAGPTAPQQHAAAHSGEVHIFTAEGRERSPPTLELSTGRMNPRAPGRNQRLVNKQLYPIEHEAISE